MQVQSQSRPVISLSPDLTNNLIQPLSIGRKPDHHIRRREIPMNDARRMQTRKSTPNSTHQLLRPNANPLQRKQPLTLLLHLTSTVNFPTSNISSLPFHFFRLVNFHLSFGSTTKHLPHAPPLNPLHSKHASWLIDPQHSGSHNASPCAPGQSSSFELQSCASERGVECRMPICLGEAVFQDDWRGCRCGRGRCLRG